MLKMGVFLMKFCFSQEAVIKVVVYYVTFGYITVKQLLLMLSICAKVCFLVALKACYLHIFPLFFQKLFFTTYI
ncbi:hypothetical protein AVL50_30070 [Flammeovirga sp. SJP92]|nr:hypothetical protein AVL50_30070 [Flammeovirga sp. SJP92]